MHVLPSLNIESRLAKLATCASRCRASISSSRTTKLAIPPFHPTTHTMAPAKSSSGKDTYSVILPTFNERQNLPIITWLLNRTFTEKFVDPIIPPMSYALSAIPDPTPSSSSSNMP
jgi:hypothetical protein